MANIYLKHKYSSTLYLLTKDSEYRIFLLDGTITKKRRHSTLNSDKLLDKKNFINISRVYFVDRLSKHSVQLSSDLLGLINAQMSYKINYELL